MIFCFCLVECNNKIILKIAAYVLALNLVIELFPTMAYLNMQELQDHYNAVHLITGNYCFFFFFPIIGLHAIFALVAMLMPPKEAKYCEEHCIYVNNCSFHAVRAVFYFPWFGVICCLRGQELSFFQFSSYSCNST